MRFLFCACAISFLLSDWSGVDLERCVDYIQRCITYEGGIALSPGHRLTDQCIRKYCICPRARTNALHTLVHAFTRIFTYKSIKHTQYIIRAVYMNPKCHVACRSWLSDFH